MKSVVLVSGKNGQLGLELQQLASFVNNFEFVFTDRADMDITDTQKVEKYFAQYKPSYFINAAAYTAVDKAETEQSVALLNNAEAVGFIATLCTKYNTTFITVSTDYVFAGNATVPYKEDEVTNPVNYYGYSKLIGEKLAVENCKQSIVIRTSWVYSTHGKNFVKTMLALMSSKQSIQVVNDQVGSPTYAADLAATIVAIILQLQQGNKHYGLYHYSNTGVISWFDFALAIKELSGLACAVNPIPTTSYPTAAKRPSYSVFDTQKIRNDFLIELKDWKESLAICIQHLEVNK